MLKVHIKKAYWAFNKKKGHWFMADAYCRVITDQYGTWARTPTGLIRIAGCAAITIDR